VSWRCKIQFPIKQELEYELGQMTSDSVGIIGIGVQWWKSAFFENVSPSDYTEFKIEATLLGATDVVPMFYGYVNNLADPITYANKENTCEFKVRSVEDLGSTLTAEYISTQPINTSIDGAGTDGLILHGISGLYVKSANVTSFVLQKGVHVIQYTNDGTTRQARLDEGRWITISTTGSVTLCNGETSVDDTQKVEMYVTNTSYLPTSDAEDKIIVTTAGTVLPNCFYRNVTMLYLLQQMYPYLGISSMTFDTFEFKTWNGLHRAFWMEKPPNDPNVSGATYAIESDGTDIYVSIGGKIFKRTTATAQYTFIAELPSAGTYVTKMIYNARNGHLWVVYGGKSQYARRLILSSATWSAEVTILYNISNDIIPSSICLMDYNYTGTSYKYGLIFPEVSRGVRFLDHSTMTVSDLTISGTANTQRGYAFLRGGIEFTFKMYYTSQYHYHSVSVTSAGAFIDNGQIIEDIANYQIGIYSPVDDRIYFQESTSILSHGSWDNTYTNHLTLGGLAVNDFTLGGGYVWFNSGYNYYRMSGTASATLMSTEPLLVRTTYYQSVYVNGRVYGFNNDNAKIFQYHNYIPMFVPYADFDGKSITEAITDVLLSYMLIAGISANKKVIVYKRCDDAGTLINSGNVLPTTVSEISEATENTYDSPSVDFVEVSNGDASLNYNGTSFNVSVSGSKITASYSSPLIDKQVFKELLFYKWQFLKNGRRRVAIKMGAVPFLQYEPFDGVNIVTSGQNVVVNTTSPIYAIAFSGDGSTEIEAMI
jgi:hypothetical protein